ncbi:MAG: type II toxin-antitoxin system RelE/ParE family toxin, partial [Alphaproteobacteria bacterium]|nr:type II toxin-antitoxin system RelE/ParE family toxin [Alphaproteobacteria bacterium]
MIRSFKDKRTAALYAGMEIKKFDKRVQQKAFSKLQVLDSAMHLTDLLVPPGNRLEALSGRRRGQHSIRVHDQWRLCFVWRNGGA